MSSYIINSRYLDYSGLESGRCACKKSIRKSACLIILHTLYCTSAPVHQRKLMKSILVMPITIFHIGKVNLGFI